MMLFFYSSTFQSSFYLTHPTVAFHNPSTFNVPKLVSPNSLDLEIPKLVELFKSSKFDISKFLFILSKSKSQ